MRVWDRPEVGTACGNRGRAGCAAQAGTEEVTMKHRLALAGAFVIMVVSGTAAADAATGPATSCDLYASAAGSDSNSGSHAAPFATPQKLIESLAPGQTGCLEPGVYTQEIVAKTSGTSTAPVTITSDPSSGIATIVGRIVVLGNYETWTNLNLDGSSPRNSCGTASCDYPGVNVNATGDEFSWDDIVNHDRATCVELSNWNGLIATSAIFAHDKIHQCGVRPAEGSGSCVNDAGVSNTLSYDLIYDCAMRAVAMWPGPRGTTVDHNVIDDASQGVKFNSSTSAATADATVSANLITNAGLDLSDGQSAFGIGTWWGGAVGTDNVAENNCLFNNAGGDLSGSGYIRSGNVIADPQYADEQGRDYNISSSSPCFALTGNIAGAGQGPQAPSADTSAPSAPTDLRADPGDRKVSLSWTASSDPDSAVAGYFVYRDGAQIANVTSGTSYTDSGRTNGVAYSYAVAAYDPSGNVSAQSSSVTATPQAPSDTSAPSTPTNLSVSDETGSSLTLTWSASSDDVGVAGYTASENGVKQGTTAATSFRFSSLACGTTYTLGVDAFDAAGNHSSVATTRGATSACAAGGSTVEHIVWVVMENHAYEQIIGNTTSAPYINSLANQYGSATEMFATSHPSLPNYVAMTSGSPQGITDDSGPSSHPLDASNIFQQLPGGASRSLEESMPSSCDRSDAGDYAVRHDPEVYYTNLGADCANFAVPLGATPDLSAKFTFITPNVCHDMHSNSCSGSSDVVLQGDQFLQSFVPQLLDSPEYKAGNTVIFITWDEDNESFGNHIPTIIIDPFGAHDTSACQGANYTHYSMLRYVEEAFGLPLIGGAATAQDMKGCFGLP
jgi:acid phosphatase